MNTLNITDLEMSKDLNREAMLALNGGWTFLNTKYSYSSYSRNSDSQTNGGYRYLGNVRYRVINLKQSWSRTQTKTNNFYRLEFNGYI